MKNFSAVCETRIEGGHWHAQPGAVTRMSVAPLSVAPRNIAPRLRFVPVAVALTAMALGVDKATAKQAPLSRESLAHP